MDRALGSLVLGKVVLEPSLLTFRFDLGPEKPESRRGW